MKTFVSYSFRDSELHIITLLFEELRARGFTVESSITYGILSPSLNNSKIINADYFIGIITNNTDSVNTVIRDWQIAKKHNLRNILVIEDGVDITDKSINYLRFNRSNPKVAVNKLLNANSLPEKSNVVDEIVAVGAITVALAALISLLSGSSKK